MITIICTTNRPGSLSRSLSDIYAGILADLGSSVRILDLKDLPTDFIFSSLYDKEQIPAGFMEAQVVIDESEKFVFIVPEYNGSFPGILKAFLDGLVFPASFKGKVGAMVGLSSGTQGAVLAMSHLTDILNYLGMYVVPVKPRLAEVEKLIIDGKLESPFLMNLLRTQAEQLIRMQV